MHLAASFTLGPERYKQHAQSLADAECLQKLIQNKSLHKWGLNSHHAWCKEHANSIVRYSMHFSTAQGSEIN